jgi:hypothetical protein
MSTWYFGNAVYGPRLLISKDTEHPVDRNIILATSTAATLLWTFAVGRRVVGDFTQDNSYAFYSKEFDDTVRIPASIATGHDRMHRTVRLCLGSDIADPTLASPFVGWSGQHDSGLFYEDTSGFLMKIDETASRGPDQHFTRGNLNVDMSPSSRRDVLVIKAFTPTASQTVPSETRHETLQY